MYYGDAIVVVIIIFVGKKKLYKRNLSSVSNFVVGNYLFFVRFVLVGNVTYRRFFSSD